MILQKIVVSKQILTYNSDMKKSKTEGHVRKPTTIRRAQIVDAALRIIASHGSRKFTAQLLGKEVGVTAGAIFRHFQTMNDIVEAVIESIETIIFEDFPPKEADPVKRLGIFFPEPCAGDC